MQGDNLRDYSKALNEQTIEKLLTGACIMIHGQAVANATQLGVVDTGLLRNSISYSVGGKIDGANGRSGNKSNLSDQVIPSRKDDEATVGSSVVYAAANEYGRSDMPSFPIRPYLRPAVAQTRTDREKWFKQVISEAMEKAPNDD